MTATRSQARDWAVRYVAVSSLMLAMAILHSIAKAESLGARFALQPTLSEPGEFLATGFASLIESAIPTSYEKRKDWGATKQITSGLKFKGIKTYRRKKAVPHGVWKHYKVQLPNPEQTLEVSVEDLRSLGGGRLGFTMTVQASLQAWARIKTYKYGVHLGAFELDGRTRMQLSLQCEVGMQIVQQERLPALEIQPRVTHAHVDLDDFHLRRISNADGPLVHELGSGVKSLIERDLNNGTLVARLNHAIEKKQEQLTLSPQELLASNWWPLASHVSAESPTVD